MGRRRRRSRIERHGLDWHAHQLSQPWLNYSVLDDSGRPVRPLTEREYERGLNGKAQQMAMHDAQPPRVRELVREHNVTKGQQLYAEELRASRAHRCPHGRYGPSCAQCTYDRAQAALRARSQAVAETSGGLPVSRSGEELTRKSKVSAEDVLARRKRWADGA